MKCFLALMLTLLGGISCAATGGHLLHISVPSTVYERMQPVPLIIKNVWSSSVRVYSYPEVLENGNWVTWPFRLEDGRLSAIAKIYLLDPGSSKNLEFDVRKSALPKIPTGEKEKKVDQLEFRFRVITLAVETDATLGSQFSESFVVLDPFGQAKSGQ